MLKDTFIEDVRAKAKGHWAGVFQRLDIPTNLQEGKCPSCGGDTRYRFDDKEGRGTYFCSHCGPGTGLDLVMKVNQCGARQAAQMVAEAMSLPLPETKPAREKPQSNISIVDKVNALMAKSEQGQSTYLTGKGLQYAMPLLSDSSLLVVLTNDNGVIAGAQVIKSDGSKRLVAGTVKRGSFFIVNPLINPETVTLAEGVATALSVHLMCPDALIVAAIDAGNLLSVAKVMRNRYPEAKIIIAADNDIKPDEPNTGKEKAEQAALSVAGWVALPPTEYKADWDDYRQQNGLGTAAKDFTSAIYQPKGAKMKATVTMIHNDKNSRPALNQMGASQRGEVLLAHYDGDLAIHGDSDTVHHYNGVIWEPATDKDLQREMASIFNNAEIAYSQSGVKSTVETMKLSLPQMGDASRHIIGFNNGVFDLKTGTFRAHRRDDWLLIASSVDFNQPAEGETLETHAPNFWRWLNHSVASNARKADRVLSALYMVMANRYDWQLFLEITGAGGSGKSVFAEICTLLAGKGNTVSANMKALEESRERALLVGFSLIIMPDMARYAGDGAGIKAITGGDKVAIDPKHKAPYSMQIPAVVLAINNNAMTFSDRSGGISRRRVIFNFSEVVPENERDPQLAEKIEGELAVIIRHLLARFSDQGEAKRLLHEQQKSEEALMIKREGDSLVDFCGYLTAAAECNGLLVGNAEIIPFNPWRYLYHTYLAYMRGNGLTKPVSLTRFGTDMAGAMAEYGAKYEKRKTKYGVRSNMSIKEEANEWMPGATGEEKGNN